ncbi:MAG: FlgD immunoglobulin-like domain containing protein, partial [Candidatus Limnocylindrales bacterium]
RESSRGTGTVTWDGRDSRHRVVPDGHYRVTVTARDRAGNRSEVQRFTARVLTALGRVRASASALHAADRDKRARLVRFAYPLLRRARVLVEVRNGSGDVVRRSASRIQRPGRRAWIWDGRDQSGRFVSPGSYTVSISATTSVGTMRVVRSVYVGPYRIGVSDATPGRGQRLRIRVDATERQKGAPTLVLTQAGGSPRRVRTQRDRRGDYVAELRLWRTGDPGTLRIMVTGRDDRGHREMLARELPLH